MKKIIAILLTLCMMTGVLTSCGAPSFEHREQMLSFYEEVADAIANDDDDALAEIVEEIKTYGEEYADIEETFEEYAEDFDGDFEDLEEKISELREDGKVSSSCLSALEDAVDYALYYVDYVNDPEDAKDIYAEILETVEEAIDVAKDKDSEGVREIAIDLRDSYYDKYMECRQASMEYDDQFGELYDQYHDSSDGDALMSAVSSVVNAALRYNDKEYLIDYYGYGDEDSDVSEIRKNLPCSLDIDELKDRYEF